MTWLMVLSVELSRCLPAASKGRSAISPPPTHHTHDSVVDSSSRHKSSSSRTGWTATSQSRHILSAWEFSGMLSSIVLFPSTETDWHPCQMDLPLAYLERVFLGPHWMSWGSCSTRILLSVIKKAWMPRLMMLNETSGPCRARWWSSVITLAGA